MYSEEVIALIRSYDAEDLEQQDFTVGMLYINYYDKAAQEIMHLSMGDYYAYLLTYIIEDDNEQIQECG